MAETTDLVPPQASSAIAVSGAYNSFLTATPGQLEKINQAARHMASWSGLPVHLRHPTRPDTTLANCVRICNAAAIWAIDPFFLADASYFVAGKLAVEGRVLAGLINVRAGLREKLHPEYTYSGSKITCTLTGTLTGETKPRTVRMTWNESEDRMPDWDTDPEQKMFYLVVKKWANRHFPELVLGVQVAQEVGVNCDAIRDNDAVPHGDQASAGDAPETPPRPAVSSPVEASGGETLQDALAAETPTSSGAPKPAAGDPVDFFTLLDLAAERDLLFSAMGWGTEATDGPRRKAAWKKILQPRGVTTAKELTQAAADELLAKLKTKTAEIYAQKNQAGAGT